MAALCAFSTSYFNLNLDEILQSTSEVLFPDKMGQKKVLVNSKDSMGDTPLHVLASWDNGSAIQLQVDAGAELNPIGDMGETPLHVAVRRNSISAVKELLFAGAKSNIKSEFKETAREKAKISGGKLWKEFRKYDCT